MYVHAHICSRMYMYMMHEYSMYMHAHVYGCMYMQIYVTQHALKAKHHMDMVDMYMYWTWWICICIMVGMYGCYQAHEDT